MGALGVLCMVRIARDEDRRLIERFGPSYFQRPPRWELDRAAEAIREAL